MLDRPELPTDRPKRTRIAVLLADTIAAWLLTRRDPPLDARRVLLQAAPGGYFVSLLQTLFALAAVCVLAWVVLKWGARRGLGLGRGRVPVLERVPLDARRALYLVQLGERVLWIGASESGAPTVLAELDAAELPPVPDAPRSLLDLLARKPAPTKSDPEA